MPDWELVLSSAARLQRILPDAVLVGGKASALHAEHRFSRDAAHVLTDLISRFDDVLNLETAGQTSGESPLQQLQVQLANAVPYDLEETKLSEYKNLDPHWHDWSTVKAACSHVATVIFDRVCDLETDRSDDYGMKL